MDLRVAMGVLVASCVTSTAMAAIWRSGHLLPSEPHVYSVLSDGLASLGAMAWLAI